MIQSCFNSSHLKMNMNCCIESEDQRTVLKEFRRVLQDILKPQHDDEFLLRWLRARDFNIAKAEKMIRESFKFRKKLGIDDILTNYELPEIFRKYPTSQFLGLDKEGSIVRLFMVGINDYIGYTSSISVGEMLKIFMHVLETDLKLLEERKKNRKKYEMKSTWIIDYQGFNIRVLYDRRVINAALQLLNTYQDNYPETLKVAYIVNVPSYFSWIYNIFKQFVNSVTLSKFKIYRNDEWKQEIRKLIDADKLPAFLGGNLTDPDGDPKCHHIVTWDTKIPASYYMKSNKCILQNESGMKTTTVQQRSCFECPINVQTPGTIIKWIFQTKDYNIRFGLLYKNGEQGNVFQNRHCEPILPIDNVDSQYVPESGDFTCDKPGQYILHFDNTYSWITAKQLVYKVEIEEPITATTRIN